MQKRIRVLCMLMCQLISVQIVANTMTCAEYIDVDAINNMDLVMNHKYALTGSGTNGMPETGSGTMAPCTGSGTIGGMCFTAYNEPIESVFVELESIQPEYPQYVITDSDGSYTFQDQALGFNYSVKASRDFDVYNGLSTLDVIKIVQIFYGFDNDLSPYNYIAADVNQNKEIDLKDAIDLVKLLIGIDDELENAKSWVFIDANQEFVDLQNPWPFASQIDLENLSRDTLHNNFIGVKLGDVSGNADPSSIQNAETRNNSLTSLNIADQFVEKGEKYTIIVNSDNTNAVNGMQLFLDYEHLNIHKINSGQLDEELAYFNLQQDKLMMSWFGKTDADIGHLFSIDITAKESGYLSEFIKLHQEWLPSELYINDDSDPLSIELKFSDVDKKAQFSVSQNYPNPFIDQTNIKFWIPEGGTVSLFITNSQGQLLIDKRFNAVQGENNIYVSRDELAGTGVLQYSLRFQSREITNSMLIMK